MWLLIHAVKLNHVSKRGPWCIACKSFCMSKSSSDDSVCTPVFINRHYCDICFWYMIACGNHRACKYHQISISNIVPFSMKMALVGIWYDLQLCLLTSVLVMRHQTGIGVCHCCFFPNSPCFWCGRKQRWCWQVSEMVHLYDLVHWQPWVIDSEIGWHSLYTNREMGINTCYKLYFDISHLSGQMWLFLADSLWLPATWYYCQTF